MVLFHGKKITWTFWPAHISLCVGLSLKRVSSVFQRSNELHGILSLWSCVTPLFLQAASETHSHTEVANACQSPTVTSSLLAGGHLPFWHHTRCNRAQPVLTPSRPAFHPQRLPAGAAVSLLVWGCRSRGGLPCHTAENLHLASHHNGPMLTPHWRPAKVLAVPSLTNTWCCRLA